MSIHVLMNGDAIFVYGTLKPGFLRYPYIEPFVLSKFPNTFLRGYKMYDTGYGFPYIIETNNLNNLVHGVLLTFEGGQMLRETDLMELGAGYERVRESIAVYQLKGEFGLEDEGFEAWVYRAKEPMGGTLIESGRWE